MTQKLIVMNDSGQPVIIDQAPAVAATAAPPSVGIVNIAGTDTNYARADHTHSSSVQRKRVTTASNGTYTWTFSPPYDTTPVVAYGVEGPAGTNLPYVANITSISSTSVSFQVYRSMSTTLGGTLAGIIGSVISPFSAVTSSVTLHCWAAKETT